MERKPIGYVARITSSSTQNLKSGIQVLRYKMTFPLQWHPRVICMLIGCLYIVANIQLGYILMKFRRQDAWLILTTTPNRYLYSLIFLPIQICINLYCLSSLCQIVPESHSLYFFITPHLLTIYTIIFSALFTAIDYFNGNAGYTDLKYPYNLSIIQARNVLLRKESTTSWKAASVQPVAVPVNVRTAKRIAREKEADFDFIVNYLRTINSQLNRLTDKKMWSLNLFNVFVFVASVFWTIACCILLYVFSKTGISDAHSRQFDIICQLQLVSVFIIMMWFQFRAYEFAEFDDIGWYSHEKIDLFFAGLVVSACMILIALARSSADPIRYLCVLALVGPIYNLRVRRIVRDLFGSRMAALNLFVIVVIVLLLLCVLWTILYYNK